jgi:hypothetical protein
LEVGSRQAKAMSERARRVLWVELYVWVCSGISGGGGR